MYLHENKISYASHRIFCVMLFVPSNVYVSTVGSSVVSCGTRGLYFQKSQMGCCAVLVCCQFVGALLFVNFPIM